MPDYAIRTSSYSNHNYFNVLEYFQGFPKCSSYFADPAITLFFLFTKYNTHTHRGKSFYNTWQLSAAAYFVCHVIMWLCVSAIVLQIDLYWPEESIFCVSILSLFCCCITHMDFVHFFFWEQWIKNDFCPWPLTTPSKFLFSR